jgi:Arc/MetJ-type ribon-helix-helix transcriptional regulator
MEIQRLRSRLHLSEIHMATEISTDLEAFVKQEIDSGHFSDRSSVIEHALRLMQRDRDEAIHGIKLGLEDVAAGRAQPLGEAFSDLRNEFGVTEDA